MKRQEAKGEKYLDAQEIYKMQGRLMKEYKMYPDRKSRYQNWRNKPRPRDEDYDTVVDPIWEQKFEPFYSNENQVEQE